jgi:DNA-binding transcriptional MocR family regulator
MTEILSLGNLLRLARDTVSNPREGMYDYRQDPRRFPDPRRPRGERQAAGLSRQRRLGAEAAGGDRRVTQAYSMEYANVHRGLHYLSNLATEKYEAVRGTIARFLGVADEDEIVFTSGTTEGINLVAYGWAMPRMEAGDEIVLSSWSITPISCPGISCANGRAWC